MLSLARGKEGSFKLVSGYRPEGDQPAAIDSIVRNLKDNVPHQVLLGVTGSGKTFTMANVIEKLNRPSLVMAPKKTRVSTTRSTSCGIRRPRRCWSATTC